MSEDFLEVLVKYGNVTGFIPAYSNQAITFTGEDMGSDRGMMIVLLYMVNFSGLEKGKTGSVRFIVETDEIKK